MLSTKPFRKSRLVVLQVTGILHFFSAGVSTINPLWEAIKCMIGRVTHVDLSMYVQRNALGEWHQ